MFLEDELAKIATERLSRSTRVEAVLLSLGGASGEPATLAAVADRIGYSREGVRHCVAALRGSIAALEPETPLLDQALAAMTEAAPCTACDYGEMLVSRGVTRGPFPISAALRWAEILGRTVPPSIELAADGELIPSSLSELYGRLPVALRKIVGNHGAAQVNRCAARLADHGPVDLLRRLIRTCVECGSSFRWIDAELGWFWVPAGRSPMLTDVRKVLAACRSIEVESLHNGISRFYRRHGLAPPPDVLLQWCRQVAGLAVAGTRVTADPPLDPRAELFAEELRLYDLLRARGGPMTDKELHRAWLAHGGNLGMLRVLRMNAPFVRRTSARAYALRDPEGVDGGRDCGREDRGRAQAMSTRWTPGGGVIISYRLTARGIIEPRFALPYALRKVLNGGFQLRTADGESLGTVEARIPGGLCLDALFTPGVGHPGMGLELEFDLAARVLRVKLSGSDAGGDDEGFALA